MEKKKFINFMQLYLHRIIGICAWVGYLEHVRGIYGIQRKQELRPSRNNPFYWKKKEKGASGLTYPENIVMKIDKFLDNSFYFTFSESHSPCSRKKKIIYSFLPLLFPTSYVTQKSLCSYKSTQLVNLLKRSIISSI